MASSSITCYDRDRVGPGNAVRERHPLRPSPPESQLILIPMSDGDDDQPPQEVRQRERSRSRKRVRPHAQLLQDPRSQLMVTPESDDVSDEDFTAINPSLQQNKKPAEKKSAGPPLSAEIHNTV